MDDLHRVRRAAKLCDRCKKYQVISEYTYSFILDWLEALLINQLFLDMVR